ncbi:NAD(P)H-hydrate dehydratase [Desulfobacula phenolica]|uniref:Carbohydrate kinase n=1 Tax=Desulfobacula phenolica TaxID=90732 RepID=A0A1H2J7Y4_9BACT|nr:NAD(P)H-hydrate dehydratase [Desulfobacula phenolica]SDU52573.1 Carbohydrate kinase [Desulfobacula phenolica]
MLAVVGTVPDPDFPLTVGRVDMVEDKLVLNGLHVPVNRGTPALLGAMINTLKVVGQKDITGFIAGDIGLGEGSRNIYQYIVENCSGMDLNTIVFHYLQPDVDWHNKILFVLKDLAVKPIMIADAGFMYAAKMSGQAEEYDLFTPDVGELAFLADETAPHPFYTRGFILHEDNKIPDLISRAYLHKNAAKNLLVKGSTDFVADKNGIVSSLNSPEAQAMEAMGGTGDTLTGIVTALIGTGMKIPKAAAIASTVNRLAGVYAAPTPATQVLEIIQHIPAALEKVLKE